MIPHDTQRPRAAAAAGQQEAGASTRGRRAVASGSRSCTATLAFRTCRGKMASTPIGRAPEV
jgi:hypothetical protein